MEGGSAETEVVQVASVAPESPLPEVGVQGGGPPVNDVSEQANKTSDSQPESIVIDETEGKPLQSSAEMLCEELEEGMSDDDMFKLTQKRKSSGSGHSNAKACKASRGARSSQGSAPSSQEDVDGLYPPSDIRIFLETTKGQRLPSVEDHFPDLLSLRQGENSVAKHSVDFRVLALKSWWDERALQGVFLRSLRDELRDELASRDETTSSDELISLSSG